MPFRLFDCFLHLFQRFVIHQNQCQTLPEYSLSSLVQPLQLVQSFRLHFKFNNVFFKVFTPIKWVSVVTHLVSRLSAAVAMTRISAVGEQLTVIVDRVKGYNILHGAAIVKGVGVTGVWVVAQKKACYVPVSILT